MAALPLCVHYLVTNVIHNTQSGTRWGSMGEVDFISFSDNDRNGILNKIGMGPSTFLAMMWWPRENCSITVESTCFRNFKQQIVLKISLVKILLWYFHIFSVELMQRTIEMKLLEQNLREGHWGSKNMLFSILLRSHTQLLSRKRKQSGRSGSASRLAWRSQEVAL